MKENIILSPDNNNNNQSLGKRRPKKKSSRNIHIHTNAFTTSNNSFLGFYLCVCVYMVSTFYAFYDIEC